MSRTLKDAENATARFAEEVKEEVPKAAAKVKEKTAEAAEKTARAAQKTVKKARGMAKKAEEITTEAKAAVVKAAAKAPARKPSRELVYLQYAGKEINKDTIVKRVKEIWTKELGRKIGEIHTMTLYLKPEENKAYYVINGDVTGSVSLD